ncbi:MAG: hypothetical protein HFF44_01950 [Lawsonibacter sp.]|nr:hypothetical protein [Lawsonibacter sp.]
MADKRLYQADSAAEKGSQFAGREAAEDSGSRMRGKENGGQKAAVGSVGRI